MFKDINGDIRYKVGLHIHTTMSDGKCTPEEIAAKYKAAGYDLIAITDHWIFSNQQEIDGLTIMSGAEYNIGGRDGRDGVYHIVALGCIDDPMIEKTDDAQTIVDKINAHGGMAVLAHPAWSINIAHRAMEIEGFGATEIYNTVSGKFFSSRPYSGDFVDTSAILGRAYNLLSTDDVHKGTVDACFAATMVKAKSGSVEDILEALKAGDFYCVAGDGPQVFIEQNGEDITLRCTPSVDIRVHSNVVYAPYRRYQGEPVTEYTFKALENDNYLRVEAYDENGNVGYTNFLKIDTSFAKEK